jgi:CelD/BcsL family acetyltransferase involved in cellulose biosynthesis
MTSAAVIAMERPATREEWQAAWRACPSATYFHSPAWTELWARSGRARVKPEARLVRFTDGLTAVLIGSRERLFRGLASRLVSTSSGTYGGWLIGAEADATHARALAAVLLREPDLWWRLNPYDRFAAAPEGVEIADEETDVLPLEAGFEVVWRRASRGHRSAANKAARLGIEVRCAASNADWDDYFAVYQDSLRRWRARRGAASEYGAPIFEALRRQDPVHVSLWLARLEGRVVAGALCVAGPEVLVYWHGATLEAAFEYRPSTLLIREVVREACARGMLWFDFNPSAGLEGVREFKRRFGTQTLSCPVVVRRSTRTRGLRRLRDRRPDQS